VSSIEMIDFSTALRAYSKRGAREPHSTWSELEAYLRGDLSEAQWGGVTEHLGECEECRLLLLEAGGEHITSHVIDDHQLGEIWRELCAHLVKSIAHRLRLAGDQEFPSPDDQINLLYDKIASLAQEEAQGVHRESEIERAYEELRALQAAEANHSRRELEDWLEFPLDAGEQILARVQSLREELEDLEATDPPFEEADGPQTLSRAS